MKHGVFTVLVPVFLAACASVEQPTTSTGVGQSGQQNSVTTSPSGRSGGPGTASSDSPSVRTPSAAANIAAPSRYSVYFAYDRDDIKPEFRSVVEEHARYLAANPTIRARVEGNADERGSREYNLALGQRRAEAVLKTLKIMGIPESRVEAVSYGEEKPRRSGHDESSWAENRRGDVVLGK